MELIEDAISSGKKNAIEKLGASNVGESWGMLENADCVILIQREEVIEPATPDDPDYFLAMKQLKFRGKKLSANMSFIQPFEKGNGMKLVDDVNFDKPASIESLEVINKSTDNGFKKGTKKKVDSMSRRSSKKKLKDIEDELDDDLSDFN